jgi:hypothetical protein
MARHFGGLGGIWEGRPVSGEDEFELAAQRQLGDAIRADPAVGVELWCALANVDWQHDDGSTASYTFRAAGDLVAAIRGEGMYLDFYCSGPDGVVSERIEEAMAREGWHGTPIA